MTFIRIINKQKWKYTIACSVFVASMSLYANKTIAQTTEYRQQPFLPNPTPEEDKKRMEDARVQAIVRDMMGEIKSVIQIEITQSKKGIIEESVEAIKADPSYIVRQQPPPPSNSSGNSQGSASNGPIINNGLSPSGGQASSMPRNDKPPEGARFISCINGKALYRDGKENTNFFWSPPPGTSSPCVK